MGKTKHAISNWATYNHALINRASLRFLMDKTAIATWYCPQHHGKRGRGFEYSDTAIETALMLKTLFKLPLRALEGFIYSLLQLMKLPQLQLHQQARQDGQYPLPSAEQRGGGQLGYRYHWPKSLWRGRIETT